nr:ribonuclease H-like domain-containing protein [Halorhodospira halophila]
MSKRIDRLRAQAGGRAVAAVSESATPGVRERLARIETRQRRAAWRPRSQRPDDQAVAEQVGGSVLAPGLIEVERVVGLDTAYGRQSLAPLRGALQGMPEGAELDPQRALWLDTETTGLAGGTGTVVFLLGVGCLAGSDLRVRHWLLTGFSGEPAMLERLSELLGGTDGLVTYNGKSFDIPLLQSRARLHGVDLGLQGRMHLDLLHPTRRVFRRHWPNCRLTTAERRLLGRERLDDLPGAEAPAAWLDFLQRGDPRQLPAVVRHNSDDILALAALWVALDRVYREGGAS